MKDSLPMSEAELQAAVVQAARLMGWRVFHPWTSVHSTAGWPDLVMVRGRVMLCVELKSERGKVSPAQQEWLKALAGVEVVEVATWRPSGLDEALEYLKAAA